MIYIVLKLGVRDYLTFLNYSIEVSSNFLKATRISKKQSKKTLIIQSSRLNSQVPKNDV